MADSWIKAGDTAPPMLATLEDSDGDPVNLTDATVRFLMRPIRGGPVTGYEASNDQNDDGTDGSKGKVSYDWADGGNLDAGGFFAEWEVTYSDDSKETFPNSTYVKVAVVQDLEEAETS